MARLAPKLISDYPWYIRWFLRRQQRVYGAVLAPSWQWGRLPGAFLGMLGLLRVFQHRSYPADAALRSLLSVRIAQLNGCHFCVDLNAYNYLEQRGDADKAAAVAEWRDSPVFTTAECAALAWAEQVTSHCAEIDQSVWDQLSEHYSDDEIAALTAWIAFQNMSAKFNAALGVEEHGFCRTPSTENSPTQGRKR
ncbi:MAG: carboxymuconolactone decarboxylase family protein [Wenzhouxiangella sp.]